MADKHTDWHHAPAHVFVPNTMYMVTAGTLHKKHLFKGHERLKLLEKTLFRIMKDRGWKIRAWALFSSQYPFYCAGWIERNFRPAFQKQLASFKYDQLTDHDEFQPAWSESSTEVPHSENVQPRKRL